MPAPPGKRLRSLLRNAIDTLVDRVLGSDAEDGWEYVQPGELCTMVQSIVGANGGVLLKGSRVEFTGILDRDGRLQVRIVEIPDHEWSTGSRLPYGPGFVLYVSPECLRREGPSNGKS